MGSHTQTKRFHLFLSPLVRYIAGFVVIVFVLHSVFSVYSKDIRLPTLEFQDSLKSDDAAPSKTVQVGSRANATLVMLVRNSEVNEAADSIRQMEDRFNRNYNYPWVFLNDVPFTEEFIERTKILVSGNVSYGLIPHDHWNQPDWIDEEKAKAGRDKLVADNIIYGGSVPYRNMCRFNSGFFFKHELLQKYRYYWRVEPGVEYFCDVNEDPLMYMQEHKKVYGFVISLYEWAPTIPSLWQTVKEFFEINAHYLAPDNMLGFLSEDSGNSYDLCHYWSNFEIADMDFWRGGAYSAFFEHLDKSGGFYYERWGDAPVHSIGVSLMANRDQIHFFNNMGYKHSVYGRCPQGELHTAGKCWCDPKTNFDYDGFSCLSKWEKAMTANRTSQF